jgi:hypothetical protein
VVAAEVVVVGVEDHLLLKQVRTMLVVAVAVVVQDLTQAQAQVVVQVNPEQQAQARGGNPVLMVQALLVEQGDKVAYYQIQAYVLVVVGPVEAEVLLALRVKAHHHFHSVLLLVQPEEVPVLIL